MKKTLSRIIGGIIVLLVGVFILLGAAGIIDLSIFRVWWPAIIIVIALITMISNGINGGNIIALLIGVILLLSVNGLLGGINIVWLIIGVIVIGVGLGMLFARKPRHQCKEDHPHWNEGHQADMSDNPAYYAVFSGTEMENNSKDFKGAKTVCVFGGLELDLRNIEIQQDAYISTCTVFGGTEIYVPSNIPVKVSGVPVFGGNSDYTHHEEVQPGTPVLYIHCTAVFGGTEIMYHKKGI